MFLPSLASIATKNVITVTLEHTIGDAIEIMNSRNIRDIVVVSGTNHFILTIHDIIKLELDGVSFNTKLSDIKLQVVPEVNIKSSLFEAIDSIKDGIDHLCLVDSDKNLVGIISYSDLIASVDTQIFDEQKSLGNILNSRHFLKVESSMSTRDVFELMQDGHHSSAIIFDSDKAVGVLTQKDIIKLLHLDADISVKVATYMSSPIKTVPISLGVNEALEYSRGNKIKRIVVASECGENILGVISQKELFSVAYGRWNRFLRDHQKQLEETVKLRTIELQNEIAQRIQTEKELEEYKTHLEELVAKKSKELEEQKKKQMAQLFHQSRISAMGEMIRSVAHHWRQPLNAIAMELQDIKFSYNDGRLTSEYLDDAVANAMTTIKEMSKTIDFARGMFEESDKTACCAMELVKKAYSLISADMQNSSIDVFASCYTNKILPLSECYCDPFSPDTKLVMAYTGEFQQAIVAILSNAKDAISAKRVEAGEEFVGKVTISFQIEGDYETITIKDNGGGINSEVAERIFDPFFTTKEIGKGEGVITGVGLGLYFAKMIIEDKMDGKLSMTNGKEGAEFKIALPYCK